MKISEAIGHLLVILAGEGDKELVIEAQDESHQYYQLSYFYPDKDCVSLAPGRRWFPDEDE